MERRQRAELQRLGILLLLPFCAASCALGVPAQPHAEFRGEPLTPNEQYHAVEPCSEHILAPARVLLEVAIDAEGKPLEASVTSLGGTVRQAFANCARTQLLTLRYESRGKPKLIGAVMDLRVGSYSTAGSPVPIPPYY